VAEEVLMRERVSRCLGGAVALLVACAVLLGASGCTGDGGVADFGAHPTPPATDGRAGQPAQSPPVRHFGRYVALGDSYTAAPFVPKTQLSNGCLRSSSNYPALVAAALAGTRMVDVSCSGADTASMTAPQTIGGGDQPPQFDALTSGTDLVSVGIGGNDFHLFATMVFTCTKLRSSDPTGAPCRDRFTSDGVDQLAGELRTVSSHVAQVVAGIRQRAPHAEVVVVGYPQIIPAHGTCPRLLPLAAGDYPYARRVNRELAAAVQRGARGADAYVDVFAHSRGHDICAAHPWINGRTTDINRALAYHPFAAEQAAVARLVLAALRR
jgi:hypothetical protein